MGDTITIIGVGLIGGSLAISMKEQGLADHVIGIDSSPEHIERAIERGLIAETTSLKEAVRRSRLIVLAVPVDKLTSLLPEVLQYVDQQIVIDMGSTKSQVTALLGNHPKRGRYVSTHPMWGTEYSGPNAAVSGAFVNKAVVICNSKESDKDALEYVENLYRKIGMYLVYMEAQAHDIHAAYISHISHITSFALANTVLEKEREDSAIFELASAGFESTVRLAKSNPQMWVPIFRENRDNVLDVLNEHISQLRKFKSCLERENYDYLNELIVKANGIKRIIN
jgi:prephenate dehydrogenase